MLHHWLEGKGLERIVCWMAGVIHNAGCTAPAPGNVNVLYGGEATAIF